MYRVVKPGRRIAVSVWGTPEKNEWVNAPMHVIHANMNTLSAALSDVSMFRCCQTHMIADLFQKTGLKNVTGNCITGKVAYPSKEVYWQFITEVTAPVALAINNLDAAHQAKIKYELFNFIQEMSMAGNAVFNYEALVISGEK